MTQGRLAKTGILLALSISCACVARPEEAESEDDGTSTTGGEMSADSASDGSTTDPTPDSASDGSTTDPDPTDPTDPTDPPDPPPEGGLGPWGFGYVQHPDIVAQWVGFADFDGDEVPDLFIRNADGNGQVLLGDGEGGFELLSTVSISSNSDFMRAGDYDGDGDLDVALFDEYHADAFLLRFNDGGGGFAQSETPQVEGFFGFGVNPMHFDADGDHDLFIPSGHSDGVFIGVSSGDGLFDYGPEVMVPGCYASNTAVADFDGDGLDDVIATGSCNSVPEALPLAVYRHVDGVFDVTQTIFSDLGPLIEGADLSLVDVDADDDLDIVTPTALGLYVIINEGGGTFADPPMLLSHEFDGYTQRQAPIHVDAEGHLGFILEWRDYPPEYHAALIIPDPTWTRSTTELIDLQGRYGGSADVDGDGAPDIAVIVTPPDDPDSARGPGELGIWLSGG